MTNSVAGRAAVNRVPSGQQNLADEAMHPRLILKLTKPLANGTQPFNNNPIEIYA
jgi:hypothetical protein